MTTRKHFHTTLASVFTLVLTCFGSSIQQAAAATHNTVDGTNLNFFDSASWDGAGVPDSSSGNVQFSDVNSSDGSMIFDPTLTGGSTPYTIGNASGGFFLGRSGVNYTWTQEGGNLTLNATILDLGQEAGLTGTYVMNGGTLIASPSNDGIRLADGAGATGIIDQNGGDVISTSPGVAPGWGGLYIGATATGLYQLGGGTLKVSRLDFDSERGGSGGDGTLDFDLGSTGILYVDTTDHTAAQIGARITGGDITIGGASAVPGDFEITELNSGPNSGFTEVMLAFSSSVIPEPSAFALAVLALLSLSLVAWRRPSHQRAKLGFLNSLTRKDRLMTTRILLAATTCLFLATFSNSVQATPLVGGDVIKVDLSTTGDGDGTVGADWNQITDGTPSISAGSVIRHGAGTVVDGVSVVLSSPNPLVDFENNTRHSGTLGLPGAPVDPYYDSESYTDTVGSTSPLTFTFSGLDTSLTYNLRVYSLDDNNNPNFDLTVTDGAGTIVRTDYDRDVLHATSPLDSSLIFSGISPDGSGDIAVTATMTAPANPDFINFNAIVLEANSSNVIPEPSAFALASLSLLSLGLIGWRRRR